LLSAERKRTGLSQLDLAELVGLSRTSITNIECGRQPVQLHQLYSFASVLKIDVRNLIPKESAFSSASSNDIENSSIKDSRARYIADAKKFLDKGQKTSLTGN
jgi:transcriptional regulator with XRE-family HTH domain